MPPLACLLLWKRCTSAAAISGALAVASCVLAAAALPACYLYLASVRQL